jgi:large subunit ribosomal protein L32
MKASVPALHPCPKCGDPKIPHRVCPTCGTYRDQQVIEVEEL